MVNLSFYGQKKVMSGDGKYVFVSFFFNVGDGLVCSIYNTVLNVNYKLLCGIFYCKSVAFDLSKI